MVIISIIVPVYNEEKTITFVLNKLLKLNFSSNLKKEIIVVDDGSTDLTSLNITRQKDLINNLKLFKHKKNLGKGAAIQTGIRNSKGEIIIIQDGDLEYNPDDIPRLIQPILNGKEKVVYGTRLKIKPIWFGKDKTPLLLHFFGNKFLSLITSILYGSSVSDMETGYKVFKKDVFLKVKLKATSFDFEPEVTAKILKNGIKIKEINIRTKPRNYKEGKKLNTFKDGFKALWTLLKYRFVD